MVHQVQIGLQLAVGELPQSEHQDQQVVEEMEVLEHLMISQGALFQ